MNVKAFREHRLYVIRLLRAVLLDLGDTLVHLTKPWEDVFQANLESLYNYLIKKGLKVDFQRFAETFVRSFEDASGTADLYKVEIPMQDIISKVLRKSKLEFLGVDLVEEAMMEFYRPEIEDWERYPDTTETLTALKEAGFKMGLISNSKSDWFVHAILRKSDLNRFFEVIVTSAALRIRKPRAEIFMRVLAALGVKASEAAFVGDSLHADVTGAKTLGMRTIHVLRQQGEGTSHVRPEATVSSLTEASRLIIEWRNHSVRTANPAR
jgi:putative hydrolase of the HAD superfamily